MCQSCKKGANIWRSFKYSLIGNTYFNYTNNQKDPTFFTTAPQCSYHIRNNCDAAWLTCWRAANIRCTNLNLEYRDDNNNIIRRMALENNYYKAALSPIVSTDRVLRHGCTLSYYRERIHSHLIKITVIFGICSHLLCPSFYIYWTQVTQHVSCITAAICAVVGTG